MVNHYEFGKILGELITELMPKNQQLNYGVDKNCTARLTSLQGPQSGAAAAAAREPKWPDTCAKIREDRDNWRGAFKMDEIAERTRVGLAR